MFTTTSFGQLIITNPTDKIQESRVKNVIVYKTNLSDSNKTETLRLAFFYDRLGRRKETKDYHNGKLMGTEFFTYDKNSFECLKAEYISASGQVGNTDIPPNKNTKMDCQSGIYSVTDKFDVSYTSSGLISVIVGYSKVIIEKKEKGNLKDKDGNLTNDYLYSVDKDDPQFILRFDYKYY